MYKTDYITISYYSLLQMLSETRKLVIGYYVDDGYVQSVPAMQRGVRETIQKLRENGHTVNTSFNWRIITLSNDVHA